MKITRQAAIVPGKPCSPPGWSKRFSLTWFSKVAAISILLVLVLLGVSYAPALRFWAASAWRQSSLPVVYLDVKFADAQQLDAQRRQAALTGVQLAQPGGTVSATLRIGNEIVPIQLSLAPGLGGGNLWAFQVDTLDAETSRHVLGWRHLKLLPFSSSQLGLAHSLRREGILAVLAQPVQVALNGDALGVYGAWPLPGAEWMAQQGRPAGSVVYLDQTQYWQELQRQRGAGPSPLSVDLGNCQTALVVGIDAATVQPDDRAAALVRDLQNGRWASEIVDVEKMGTWLALATLWQGLPPSDWSNIAFYLNPAASRLEPIALPAQRGAEDSGPFRWPVCFDDPVLQAAYVRAVERISRPEYLKSLQAEVGTAFDDFYELQLIAGSPGWAELEANQARMARWLTPAQPVQASWIMPATIAPGAVVQVQLANLLRAPVELVGFDVGKNTFLPFDPSWIQNGVDVVAQQASGEVILRSAGDGRLQVLALAVPYDKIFSASRAVDEPLELRVVTRLWGATRQQSALVQLESAQVEPVQVEP